MKWAKAETDKLRKLYEAKPKYITDYELAGRLSRQFHKSTEAIRWKLREFRRGVEVSFPKILLLDIETLPLEGSFWSPYDLRVSSGQLKKDWSIVCWSAKWLFGRETFGEAVKPKEAIHRQDKSVLGGIWNLIDEADWVITQNGDNFDLKKLNTRFFIAGFPPPMYYKSVDTLKVLKDKFSFTYNGIDWVASVLGIGRKIETSFKWWDECSKGNQFYIDQMLKYNKWDVELLEELYLKMRPWIPSHPNMNLYSTTGQVCPSCGDMDLDWCGKYATPLGLYKAFRCQKCGATGRSTLKQYKLASAKVSN